MCNFYMMYYRDALSNNEAPDGCGDQSTFEHLFHSFPNDSDVALASSSSGHHHHMHHTVIGSKIEGTNEATKSGVVEGNMHNSDFEKTETNGRDGLGDDVTTSNIVIPDTNTPQEKTILSPSTEASEQEGRQISNHFTDTRLPQEMSITSSTIETADGSERPNYVTHDAITDVNTDVTGDLSTSTSVSEQTTRAEPFTVEPTTTLIEKVAVKHWKGLGEDSTIETLTEHTRGQAVETVPYRGDDNDVENEHGLNIVPSQKNEVVDKLSVVDDWPAKDVAKKLGQVTGLAVDSAGRVFVFHRAGREWTFE